MIRWLRYLTITLWQAKGWRHRWMMLRYIFRMLAGRAGLHLRPKEYQLVLDGVVFHVEASRADLSPYPPIWIDHEYEPDGRFIPPAGGTVVDVGAHVGFFTIHDAKRVVSGTVFAIEPDPDSFGRLLTNCKANNLRNVRAFHLAMGRQPETTYFKKGKYSVDSRLVKSPTEGAIQVLQTTLDAFVEAQGIQQIDFLKVDTEGAEVDILRAARQAALPRTRAAVIEVHGEARIGPVDIIMKECGFTKVHRKGMLHYYYRERDQDREARQCHTDG